MMPRTIAMLCVACALAVARAAAGEDLKFNKVDVSDGPVLFFVRPEDGKGNDAGHQRARVEEALYLFDPARHKSPQPLRSGKNPTFRPVTMSFGEHVPTTARPLPHLLVMERSALCVIVDLRTGNAEALDDKHETEVVAIEGKNVYFLQRTVPYEFGGFVLDTEGGVTITEAYHRPRDFLFVRNVGEAKPRRLCNTLIERILAVKPDGFWVVTAGKDRKLGRISREGTFEAFAAFDDHWVAPLTCHAFSPKRKYMAISTLHDRHDYHKERELLVIDIEKRQRRSQWRE